MREGVRFSWGAISRIHEKVDYRMIKATNPWALILALFAAVAAGPGCGNGSSDGPLTGAELLLPGRAADFSARMVDLPEADELLLEAGPIDLPVSPPEHEQRHEHYGVLPQVPFVTLPKSVFLTGWRLEIVDGRGKPLPPQVLHHFNLINLDNRELFLPIAQRMLAVGSETGDQSVPEVLLGYPVEGGTRVAVKAMLHNPGDEPIHGARVRLFLSYVESEKPWPLLGAFPFHMDVAFPNTADTAFDLPPGRSEHSWTGSPLLAGRILVIGSHLHEHAESIRLEDVTEGELLWQGHPITENGRLVGTTVGRLYWELGEAIYPDHTYRVTVVYHNPTKDTLYDGGMGVVAGLFRPSNTEAWPAAPQDDPLFQQDMRVVTRQLPRYSGETPSGSTHQH